MPKILISIDEKAWDKIANELIPEDDVGVLESVKHVQNLVLAYVEGGLVLDNIIPDELDFQVWDYDNWEESQQCPNCQWERFPYVQQTDEEFLAEGPWNRIENNIRITEAVGPWCPQEWQDLWAKHKAETEAVELDEEEITECPECHAPLEQYTDLQEIYDFLLKEKESTND